jgi:hypothetical protein
MSSIERKIINLCNQKNIRYPKIKNRCRGNTYEYHTTHALYGHLSSTADTKHQARDGIYEQMLPYFINIPSQQYSGDIDIKKLMINIEVLYFPDFTPEAIGKIHTMMNESKEIGVDFEFFPFGSNRGKISLCQLSNDNKVILISTVIGENKETMPLILQQLFKSNIIKVFCAFYSDRTALRRTYKNFKKIKFNSIIDIQHTQFFRIGGIRRSPKSLKSLAAVILNVNLPKDPVLRISFMGGELTEAQKTYAAIDAFITLQIYKKIGGVLKYYF